jgi:hypothetical protein
LIIDKAAGIPALVGNAERGKEKVSYCFKGNLFLSCRVMIRRRAIILSERRCFFKNLSIHGEVAPCPVWRMRETQFEGHQPAQPTLTFTVKDLIGSR